MRSPSHHKRDIPRSQIGLNIRQTLIQKNEVPEIRMGKIRNPRKIHNQRQRQQIRNLHRQVDRMIVDSALGSLHPVDDTFAIRIRPAISPHRNSRVRQQ